MALGAQVHGQILSSIRLKIDPEENTKNREARQEAGLVRTPMGYEMIKRFRVMKRTF